MSISTIGTHGATTSSTVQPTAAEATPRGPSRAPESSGLQSLRSTARAVVDAGAGLARRTGSLATATAAAAVGGMLVQVAEAGYQPATGAAAAAGARHPRIVSGDGSEQAKAIGILIAGLVGAGALSYTGYKTYQHCAGKNSADTAAAPPVAAPPAGDQSPV